MTLSIPLTPEEADILHAKAIAAGVTVDAIIRDAVTGVLASSGTPAQPTQSCLGALAHLGRAPSAEDIDENRVDMFANFARDNF